VDALGAFNVFALVKGGGSAAQADAVAMGLARALSEWERCEVEAGNRDESELSWRNLLKRGTSALRFAFFDERRTVARRSSFASGRQTDVSLSFLSFSQPNSWSEILVWWRGRRRVWTRRGSGRPGSRCVYFLRSFPCFFVLIFLLPTALIPSHTFDALPPTFVLLATCNICRSSPLFRIRKSASSPPTTFGKREKSKAREGEERQVLFTLVLLLRIVYRLA
jgi:hypothetical protein